MTTRIGSSVSKSMVPIRVCFEEEHAGTTGTWRCRLCLFVYREERVPFGWPMSLDGLITLARHSQEHAAR